MELVYLWVKEYKNIKEQGFNFSPRFECEFIPDYDENKRLTNNCKLTINKKAHINIFPQNINITAIVGGNGSGKSSIINEIINSIIFNTKTEYLSKKPILCFLNDDKDTIYIYSHAINNISNVKSEFNFRLTHYNEENLPTELSEEYISTRYMSMTKLSKKFKEEYYKSFFYLYNNNLDIDSNYHHTYDYNYELLFFSEINKSNNIINLEKELEKTNSYLIDLLYEQDRIPKVIKNFFVPTKLYLDREILIPYFNNNDEEMFYHHQFFEDNPSLEEIIILETLLYLRYFIKNKLKSTNDNSLKDELESIFENKEIFNEYMQINNELNYNQYLNNIQHTKATIREDDNKSNDISHINELEKTLLLLQNINRLTSLIKSTNHDTNEPDYEINLVRLKEKGLSTLKEMPAYLKVDFATRKGRRFSDLSSGEKNLLKLLFSIEDIIQKRKTKTNSLYILIDEIETTLHPNWQKRVLKWLIYFIKHYKMQFNIIVTSHSPFILSDLPKEHIIFLKNGRQEKAFEHKQTFGANIHTLLSDGFFMQGGLIGEFAKEKINDVIELFKKDELSENDIKTCKHIISIIGEPILQKTLQSQLDNKLFSNETELQRLEREQEELEEKIKKLRKQKNETN